MTYKLCEVLDHDAVVSCVGQVTSDILHGHACIPCNERTHGSEAQTRGYTWQQ
jgi:hypothetical protein